MQMAFGIYPVVVDRGRPADPARSLSGSSTAIARGKPAIAVESGSPKCPTRNLWTALSPAFTASGASCE
jgi:hypothetical protein